MDLRLGKVEEEKWERSFALIGQLRKARLLRTHFYRIFSALVGSAWASSSADAEISNADDARVGFQEQFAPRATSKAMNAFSLSLQLISGAAAGAIAGSAFPSCDLRIIRNAVLGALGGGLGGHFLQRLLASDNTLTDTQIFLCSVAGGALGGSLLVLIIGSIRNIFTRKS